MGPQPSHALWHHGTHSLLCELIAVVQVEVLQPWPEAGCLGSALITEEAAVAQLQALQAGAAPGHCHQAFVCEFR